MRALKVVIALCVLAVLGRSDEVQRVSPCELKENPAAFNHKLVELTTFVSHGFEDFTLFDPACSDWPEIWLEYGGTAASGTMYCCGVAADRSRPKSLVVENVPVPLVTDRQFQEFDRLLGIKPDQLVHAKFIGRFFAGERRPSPNGPAEWADFGHMGCCSLLVIQQVLSVDPQTRTDVDYRGTADQPHLGKAGCGYEGLVPPHSTADLIAMRRKADADNEDWRFFVPQRVAANALARILNRDWTSITGLTKVRKSPGRVLYEWKPKGSRKKYLVVTSRPYWLSFYAKDPARTAWTTMAAYEVSCP